MSSAFASPFEEEDGNIQSHIVAFVGKVFSEPTEVIRFLSQAIQHEDGDVRSKAFSTLLRMRPYHPEAVLPLIKGLEDQDSILRYSVYRLLQTIPSAEFGTPAVATALVECLRFESTEVRCYALRLLENVGTNLVNCLSEIAKALADPNEVVRQSALNTVREIGPSGIELLPILVKLLKEETYYGARVTTALAIGSMGSAASGIVPDLIYALQHDSDETVQFHVARALTQIDPTSAVPMPTLVHHLQKYGKDIGIMAAKALQRLGALAVDSIPVMVEVLKSEEDEERRSFLIDAVKAILDQTADQLRKRFPPDNDPE